VTDPNVFPLGCASRMALSTIIRKWAEGAALSEDERQAVDDALTFNRLEMIQVLFKDEEATHVR